MRYLLDTNVISELQSAKGDELVKKRASLLDSESTYISAIVFGELRKGIQRMPKGRKKQTLEIWYNEFAMAFKNRVLQFDMETAQIWGDLVAKLEDNGTPISTADGQIAATAIQHGMILVTRNTRDFVNTGARIWNIWETDAAFM